MSDTWESLYEKKNQSMRTTQDNSNIKTGFRATFSAADSLFQNIIY